MSGFISMMRGLIQGEGWRVDGDCEFTSGVVEISNVYIVSAQFHAGRLPQAGPETSIYTVYIHVT